MRLIDADALVIYLLKNLTGDKWGIRRMLDSVDDAETIDAVPVVRCKDCKYAHPWGNAFRCGVTNYACEEDDFCSYAVKKEEPNNDHEP